MFFHTHAHIQKGHSHKKGTMTHVKITAQDDRLVKKDETGAMTFGYTNAAKLC